MYCARPLTSALLKLWPTSPYTCHVFQTAAYSQSATNIPANQEGSSGEWTLLADRDFSGTDLLTNFPLHSSSHTKLISGVHNKHEMLCIRTLTAYRPLVTVGSRVLFHYQVQTCNKQECTCLCVCLYHQAIQSKCRVVILCMIVYYNEQQ